MLVRCLYASRPLEPLSGAFVNSILEQSRKNNPALGVTGLLCVSDAVFMQVLEGGRATIAAGQSRPVRVRHGAIEVRERGIDEALAKERAAEERPAASRGPQDAAIELVQAMYAGAIVDGYEMRQRSLTPVNVGPLKVQLVAEYRGTDLSGKVLRIENKSGQAVELTEAMVAPASALAVSLAERTLPPGKATTAYLVSQTGR